MIIGIALILSSPLISFMIAHPQYAGFISKDELGYANLFLNKGLVSILTGSLFSIVLFKKPSFFSIKIKFIELFQLGIIFLIWVTYNSIFIMNSEIVFTPILITILLISLITHPQSFIFKLLNQKYIVTVGVLSYSLYIWQQIFTFSSPWHGYSKLFDHVIFNLVGLVIVAYCSYNFFEKKFLLLKQKFEPTKQQVQS
jgi:peptidoglycan/LPS O-acetylase OafA/YrhL